MRWIVVNVLFSVLVSSATLDLHAQCRDIRFESGPYVAADDLQFQQQLQATRGVRFSFESTGDLNADGPAVLEASGVQANECANRTCGFQSTRGPALFDSADASFTSSTPGLGSFFLRLPQQAQPGASLLIEFTNPEGVISAGGEIWDIDFGERWVVQGYDEDNSLVTSLTSPNAGLDSRPWPWRLVSDDRCALYKVLLRYTGQPNPFIGLAFDNLRFCDITSSFDLPEIGCSNDPPVLTADLQSTDVSHQWDVIPSDGGGTEDGNLLGPAVHTCWGPTCPLPAGLEPGYYVIKHGIYSPCVEWRETRKQLYVAAAPVPDFGPDQTVCLGDSVRLPKGCTEDTIMFDRNLFNWTPDTGLDVGEDPRCVEARPTATTTYVVEEVSPHGCTGSDTVTVTVDTAPTLDLQFDDSCCFETLTVGGQDIDAIRWDDGTSSTSVRIDNPGTYGVVASNHCGDTRATYQVDEVGPRGAFPNLYAPNGFSPNGDGVNDRFFILHAGLPAGASPAYAATRWEFVVFDKWGSEIVVLEGGPSCSIVQASIPDWDGRANRSTNYPWWWLRTNVEAGEPLRIGTYPWTLYLGNCNPGGGFGPMRQQITGHIVLIR